MTQSETEKILDKIKKVIAIAEDTDNPEEAATAAAKAQELLQRYNLDTSMIKDAPKTPVIMEKIELPSSRLWTKNLLDTLAHFNYCEAIWFTGTKNAIVFGEKTNIEAMLSMFDGLTQALIVMGATDYRQYCARIAEKNLDYYLPRGKRAYPVDVRTYKANYYQGAVNMIHLRMKQQKEEFEAKHNSMKALVVMKDAEAKEAAYKQFPKTKTVNLNTRPTDGAGFYEGVQAGKKVELNKLVTEG